MKCGNHVNGLKALKNIMETMFSHNVMKRQGVWHTSSDMHTKDPQLSVVRVGYCVLLAGFCLSLYMLYSLHVQNRDVNIIQNK